MKNIFELDESILASKELSPSDKLVYVILTKYPNAEPYEIAKRTGLSLATIYRHKEDSQNEKMINSQNEKTEGVGKINLFYRLLEENGIRLESVPRENGYKAIRYLKKYLYSIDIELKSLGINEDNILEYLCLSH